MSKISIDIEYIKTCLENIGYLISDFITRENNGTNWQIKFSNSGVIVNIYDTNNKKNTVVNGKGEPDECTQLKEIIDKLKCKELTISPLNKTIVDLINSKKEDYYYDFKQEYYHEMGDFLHDIICLSNNTENREAYLIIGVDNSFNVIGIKDDIVSNDIHDFLKKVKFAGDHYPEIEIEHILYKTHRIGVIICKSSKDVPFWITERCRKVNPNNIYTRVGDTNTPIDLSANYNDIEKLWRIHFDRNE